MSGVGCDFLPARGLTGVEDSHLFVLLYLAAIKEASKSGDRCASSQLSRPSAGVSPSKASLSNSTPVFTTPSPLGTEMSLWGKSPRGPPTTFGSSGLRNSRAVTGSATPTAAQPAPVTRYRRVDGVSGSFKPSAEANNANIGCV
eukprot:CAMPEP_0181174362 /NCGR_PEP_ID=MMETSP1096-20121128/3496_1 /TAXON_ID=156174 ORGANISM="Chrysochromulina ericina, Strain CCMP281" /NCGR_SAMPLE_ID=MMETSP1096 /ASSEMBLY_ACC=CAM_ASM_000453 /LENGTH=143 /DNA_ID=CAMNT_0023262259 /DNA_START=433 /DNA_END=861 /DNA_ORIENTATION=-